MGIFFTSFIQSYDIDLESRMRRTAQGGVASGSIAGEFFLALRRFVPDFKTLAGNCKIISQIWSLLDR